MSRPKRKEGGHSSFKRYLQSHSKDKYHDHPTDLEEPSLEEIKKLLEVELQNIGTVLKELESDFKHSITGKGTM